ncbi:MAG TPA: hypothetical protein VIV60_27995, partial [Polyangiaceae bacterium]
MIGGTGHVRTFRDAWRATGRAGKLLPKVPAERAPAGAYHYQSIDLHRQMASNSSALARPPSPLGRNTSVNKILITGLAIGAEPGIDACEVCNYDLSVLLRKPSTLLWADKVIVTEGIRRAVDLQTAFPEKHEFAAVVRTVFDSLEGAGLLEVRPGRAVITPDVRDSIFREIFTDSALLTALFPKQISRGDDAKVPGQLFVDEYEYCTPALWSIYASLVLAEEWSANILFGKHAYNFLRFKFGLGAKIQGTEISAFEQVFSTFLPESTILPKYFSAPNCATCDHEGSCRSEAVPTVERELRSVLQWRNFDEFHEMRKVFSRISTRQREHGAPSDIIAEFQHETDRLQKKVHRLFPQVERWTNLATVVSVPV